MNEKIVQEILHELFSALEAMETQSTAILQFLKDKGITNEKELAPYVEQAGEASNVRWRAVRVRIDYLLSSDMKTAEQDATKQEVPKTTENHPEPRNSGTETSRRTEKESTRGMQKTAASTNPEIDDVSASAEKDRNRQGGEGNRATKSAGEKSA